MFTFNLLLLFTIIHYPSAYSYRPYTIRNDANRREPIRPKIESDERQIPLDFVQKIANYTVSDLLLHYIDDYEDDILLANRFGEDIERSSAVTPKSANCMPELQVVELVKATDPSVMYIPTCTRLERCGGCCTHNLLTCQPIEAETVSFKVIKTQFSNGRLKYVGKEVVHMEKHTKCVCGCKTQKNDCNALQEYRQDECTCVCANSDEERKCHLGSASKLWDPDSCACRCRDISQCSTGFTFDSNTCKCVPMLIQRRFAESVQEIEEHRKAKNVPPQIHFNDK